MQPFVKQLIRITLAVVVCLFGSLACSSDGKLNVVKGKVTYKGEPLAGALVTFHPKGKTDVRVELPTGFTKEDGTFAVKTGHKDGAVAGDYVVTVICIVTPPKKDTGKKITFDMGNDESYDRFQGKYTNKETSKFSVTITNGDNQIETIALE